VYHLHIIRCGTIIASTFYKGATELNEANITEEG